MIGISRMHQLDNEFDNLANLILPLVSRKFDEQFFDIPDTSDWMVDQIRKQLMKNVTKAYEVYLQIQSFINQLKVFYEKMLTKDQVQNHQKLIVKQKQIILTQMHYSVKKLKVYLIRLVELNQALNQCKMQQKWLIQLKEKKSVQGLQFYSSSSESVMDSSSESPIRHHGKQTSKHPFNLKDYCSGDSESSSSNNSVEI